MMNIDCQIRNKTTVHEALSTMCEDEIMEGDNKVLCDRCKVKTSTVLRTAVSALPDVLVLSLKRFDLDYTTFETVKLNSRCEFGQSLNMKQYTLEAKELLEAAGSDDPKQSGTGSMMDLGENDGGDTVAEDPLSTLPDDDYEYRLAGVLVHAGVAQGGHYYSFIKDRTSDKWYRFDDEDVTPFDPSLIEQECFGGKVKKETKFPNGHVHTTESEQFANALMVFYEKVKPVEFDETAEDNVAAAADGGGEDIPMDEAQADPIPNIEMINGYDVFLPTVKKSNSTHSWQSFLLTNEFQLFVKDILGLCTDSTKATKASDGMDITPVSSPSPTLSVMGSEVWRFGVVKMSLSFLFDVLFHLSLGKKLVRDWTDKILQVFTLSPDATAAFVSDLAKRTHGVYENWVRAYAVECSEESSRRAALDIFAFAMHSQASQPAEQSLLQNWILGWNEQWTERERMLQSRDAQPPADLVLPTKLVDGQLGRMEVVSDIGGAATGVGIILSFVSQLLELSPRYVQSNVDLFYFIRTLAQPVSVEGQLLRDAMISARIPERLFALACRDKSHHWNHQLFPGACVPFEIVEALARKETQSNFLHIGMNNSGMNNTGMNNHPYAPTLANNRMLLEAIGTMMGMPWVIQTDLTEETDELNRGRAIVRLTPAGREALTILFEEFKSSPSGLNKNNIQFFAKRCGIRDIPPQRIEHLLSRHGVEDESDGSRVLGLKGFLEYFEGMSHEAGVSTSVVSKT